MALSVALPLSGLEIDQFRNLAHLLVYNRHNDVRPASPSTRSESSSTSGISSLVPNSNYTSSTTPSPPRSPSPKSSRSASPNVDKENSNDERNNDIKSNAGDGDGDGSGGEVANDNQEEDNTRSISPQSKVAADLCELNQFYRQLLQLPTPGTYRRVINSRRLSVSSGRSDDTIGSKMSVKIVYRERDILNLEANLREPSWQMINPNVPKHNVKYFMANRSVYYRLGEHGLKEDYPMRLCKYCDFNEPSPYLF